MECGYLMVGALDGVRVYIGDCKHTRSVDGMLGCQA